MGIQHVVGQPSVPELNELVSLHLCIKLELHAKDRLSHATLQLRGKT